MKANKIRENFPKKLLVEGKDDQHITWALCKQYEVTENFDVIDSGGFDDLIKQLPVRFKQADIKSIGIVIDADEDFKNRWQKIGHILERQGLLLPDICPKQGVIIKKETIKVGIWLMPDNEINGMIEDFIRFLIPEQDDLMPIVENHIKNIEQQNKQRYAKITAQRRSYTHGWHFKTHLNRWDWQLRDVI